MTKLEQDLASIAQTVVRLRCGSALPTSYDIDDAVYDVLKLFPLIEPDGLFAQSIIRELRIRMLLPAD